MRIEIDGEQKVVARTGDDDDNEGVIGVYWIGKIEADSEVVIKMDNGTPDQVNVTRNQGYVSYERFGPDYPIVTELPDTCAGV